MSRRSLSIQDAALAVVKRLRDAGHEALWAGGCVRDMLLGIEPSDIDVATSAHPPQIVELFRRTREVGVQFGVVLVKQGPHWIEVATFRTDVNYVDGRRPERVVFTTAEEDAQRRDFTINGLFYDPLDRRVIDYVGGEQDVRSGIVRAIGEPSHRFAEDHLRLLRAVRFTTRFGFQLDPATAAAIREHAAGLARISAERIREEL
ncbi:MAG TPA: CCA tRNA nucleotidyltransferase, partial [Phycisphaerae bacterium]|nr:CCA tRNA nucleotidyltransferase [Phycisphaerae bacterium]